MQMQHLTGSVVSVTDWTISHTQTRTQTHCVNTETTQHTQQVKSSSDHINLSLCDRRPADSSSVGFLQDVLHFGKIKLASGRTAEYVQHVAARCLEVARRIVAR